MCQLPYLKVVVYISLLNLLLRVDNYDDSSSDISMPSDVTVDSDSDSHSENDTDNNNQGRKSWGDGGDIYPPCFDIWGVADIDDTRSDLDSLY